jgi:hypothetical protein
MDARLDQQLGEGRVVGRRLAAKPDLGARLVGAGDGLSRSSTSPPDRFLNSADSSPAVAVDAERQLGQVVRPDGEAVEAFGEFLGPDHVRGNLAS